MGAQAKPPLCGAGAKSPGERIGDGAVDTLEHGKLICTPVNLAGSKPPANTPIKVAAKAVAIIPARLASNRFPGKALAEISGKPMICWVAERASAARNVARVIIATDDEGVVEVVCAAGFEAMLTRTDHPSGTDRIAEVAAKLSDAEIIVNVQGDEPLISPKTIENAVGEMAESGATREVSEASRVGIVTTWEPIERAEDVLNPDVVKIVVDGGGSAVYFSRSPVPFPQDAVRRHGTIEAALANEPSLLGQFRKHTGLYVFRKDVLLEFTGWPQSRLERLESLEQLRALEHGVKIKAVEAATPSIGVDTEEDLERVRALVASSEFRIPSSVSR